MTPLERHRGAAQHVPMRQQLCLTLAKHADQPLTREVAAEIVRELFPDRSVDPAQFGEQRYGRYVFRAERFSEILQELHQLHELHYLETEKHKAGIALNADYEAAIEREHAGSLVQFTARTEEGELVGSMRVYVMRSMHTRTLYCEEDVFFIVPQHRGTFMAIRLWQFVEEAMRKLGVREVRFDSKLLNKADVMAKYLNYTPVSLKHVKILEPIAPKETADVQ